MRKKGVINLQFKWQQPVIILDKTGADDILAHLAICSCMDHIHPHLGKYYVDTFAIVDDGGSEEGSGDQQTPELSGCLESDSCDEIQSGSDDDLDQNQGNFNRL